MTLAIIDATYRADDDARAALGESRYTMPLANVPLIAHVAASTAAAGARRTRVITAPGDGRTIERALAAGGSPAPLPEVVEAPSAQLRRALLAELDVALGGEQVLLVPGDGLHGELLGEMTARLANGDVDAVLDASVAVAVERLCGAAVLLGAAVRPLVARLLDAGGDGSLIDALLADGLRLAVCDGDAWTYGGDTTALLAGNRRALDALPDAPAPGEIVAGNELHGRIRFGRSVIVSGCIVHGPVAIADHAVLEDSHVGPFTSIGPGAIVSGAELEDSIVLAGAEIRHPGHRITASVIGAGARVDRGFALPRGVRLRLGPGAHLRFS